MDEKLLQYIWKNQLFDGLHATTTDGIELLLINTGTINSNSGPDFFNAKIRIGDTLWVGCVELHLRASDWNLHKHQNDAAYSNVILHVVYENDTDILDKKGNPIPTLELKPLIKQDLIAQYNYYMSSQLEIVCQNQFESVPSQVIGSCLNKMLVERLENRKTTIDSILDANYNHKEEAFYQILATSFGFKTNSEPFGLLAKSLPLSILGKHKSDLLQIEALLFGLAGFLDVEPTDDYTAKLQREYLFLKQKFSLSPLCECKIWKFSKTYPSGFPTIRIAQFAALIHQSSALLSKILEVNTIDELIDLFTVTASDYWTNHFKMGVQSNQSFAKSLGITAIHSLIINTVLPFMYAYGRWNDNITYIDKCICFYSDLPLEDNTIVRKYNVLREFSSALHSQGLLQLYNIYCKPKRCLDCRIGIHIL
ncbi:MAG: DUF2851 family protein [Bacteroidales bacterium]|jgi:hypothetical protein|nr:DUF2851 family protein [Bacteroidales bacterium]